MTNTFLYSANNDFFSQILFGIVPLDDVHPYFCLLLMNGKKRHIAKTITWRIVATGTTFLLTLIFFREDPDATTKASWVALIESIFKMVLYYYHERVWFRTNLQIKSSVRHLIKTVTWRIIASITTFIIAFLIFKEDPLAAEKATGIAVVESFLKMLFYYLHERAWHSTKFGLNKVD